MISPDLNQFLELAKEFNVVPVHRQILVDFDTPVSLFQKVAGSGEYAFLLESLEGGERWGRYSIIGLQPFLVVKTKGNQITLERRTGVEMVSSEDPLEYIRGLMKGFSAPELPELPRFYGGAVGFLGYDMVRFVEELPNAPEDTAGFNDAVLMFPEVLLVFDNLKQNLNIIACLNMDQEADPRELYRKGQALIETMVMKIRRGIDYPDPGGLAQFATRLEPEVPEGRFKQMVEQAKEYIRAGDIIQVVLSQRFSGRSYVEPFELYRAIRRINPSPYLYFLRLGDEILVGSSPEILVRVTGDLIEVRPIAGTRPRGRTEQEDLALERELLADEKEKAEHVMLVDLGRNDVGRVARPGSVKVDEFMVIERYSHVMHIVSSVTGRLAKGLDSFDVFRACFPAGTVSGAPKIRAMEIIDELEQSARGPYAGAVGVMGYNGNMDLAITIRTLCQKGEMLYLQAGAGIVADSVPEKEWLETINKGKALMRAVEEAQKLA